jgi:hypothetical protein
MRETQLKLYVDATLAAGAHTDAAALGHHPAAGFSKNELQSELNQPWIIDDLRNLTESR